MSLLGSVLGWVFKDERSQPVTLDSERRKSNQHAWSQLSRARPVAARALEVARIQKETADTVSIYLRDDEPLSFEPGQFLTCCFQIDGRELRRAYSISSLPGDPELRITVKRLKNGAVSSYIHQRLQVGDAVKVMGPSGDFVLPAEIDEAVFIAGGSGITPIRSLIESLLRRAPQARLTLIYVSRGPRHIIFGGELEALAQQWPNLNLRLALSKPGKNWQGIAGRINPELLRAELMSASPDANRHLFVCGPEGLMEMATSTLQELGIDSRFIHTERFLAAASANESRPTQPQTIRFRHSGKQVVAQPGQTLLEAGLAAGLGLPYSCQVGGCGHCRIRINTGTVISDEPNCLSEQEKNQGYRLACLSYACSEVEVDA